MKAGSLRINCPDSTNRVVLDITANDEPPIRIVRHGDKTTQPETSNTEGGNEQSNSPGNQTPSAITEALAGIRETIMSEAEADDILTQNVKGYATRRNQPPLMTDGDLGIEEASVSSGSSAREESQPSGSSAPRPNAEPAKPDDKQEHPPATEAEVHHVTSIVIERKTVTSRLDSITWLNRELAWIVIFLWLVALGIGATAAIIFAIGLFNKVTA